MRVLVCTAPRTPLITVDRPLPEPRATEVLVRVRACGVCRTDLHIQDQEVTGVRYPIVPGHQAVGDVVQGGPGSALQVGARVGVPWLASTCGECDYCRNGRENLCDRAEFTGCHRDGGFAEFLLADSRFCLPLPGDASPEFTAPLLCAGLIGYRSLRLAGQGRRVGPARPRAAGRGPHLCAGWQPGAQGTAGRKQGWRGGLRWHTHERHPGLSLRGSVGGTAAPVGGQPDPGRRPGVFPGGSGGEVAARRHHLSAAGSQPGAG